MSGKTILNKIWRIEPEAPGHAVWIRKNGGRPPTTEKQWVSYWRTLNHYEYKKLTFRKRLGRNIDWFLLNLKDLTLFVIFVLTIIALHRLVNPN